MTSLPLMQSVIIIDHSIHHIKSCQFHHLLLLGQKLSIRM